MIVGRNGGEGVKNRIAIVILLSLFLSTGCQSDKNNEMPELRESFRNMGGESITRLVSIYVGEDQLLHMYDSGQKTDIVLCNKADCSHGAYDEIKNADPSCNAALNKELFSSCVPIIAGSYIYLFGKTNMSQGVVYRENLDGSGRTRLYTINYQLEMGSSVYVKDNIAYAEANIPIVSDDNMGGVGTNDSYSLMLRIDLETGKTKELSPVSKEKFQSIQLLDKKKDKLYYSFTYRTLRKQDKDYSTAPVHCAVYEYDMKTEKQMLIFKEKELEGVTPVGLTEKSLCSFDRETGKAFEISLKDKRKNCIYQPSDHKVIYFVFNNQWIVGDMKNEHFFQLKDGKLEVLPDIVSFSKTFGNYAEFYRSDGVCQVVYGNSLFTDSREIIFERK